MLPSMFITSIHTKEAREQLFFITRPLTGENQGFFCGTRGSTTVLYGCYASVLPKQ